MGKMQRNKGATFERLVANKIKSMRPDLMPKRGIGQARSSSEVPDVDIPGLWIECKHHIKVDVDAAMRQALEASATHGGNRTVAVVYRHNRSPIRARVHTEVCPLATDVNTGESHFVQIDVALEDFVLLIPQWLVDGYSAEVKA